MQDKCKVCDGLINPRSGENGRKYCSLRCYWISKVGTVRSQESIEKQRKALTGVKKSPEHIAKVIAANKGKKHPSMQGVNHFAWQGDNVRYDSLHDWVARYKGRTRKCDECGLDDPKKTYHWGNISGDYKRDLNDWIRLCVPCHSKMDKGRNDLNRVWKKVGNAYIRRERPVDNHTIH